ncbi:hypothetical protein M6G53_17115 [Serratia nevei]|uniref:hypothetical protein n=1 Tax=Serratia nevei TaxID=2703794 RepID=UPI00209F6CEC|nr:hypothetical protein [Serratia nevei]MCP1107094.1 hypothetical protein [Serratia nevei]
MKVKHILLVSALLLSPQMALAGVIIDGDGIYVYGNGQVDVSGDKKVETITDAEAAEKRNAIYAAMCTSPFMKKYAPICK